MRQGWRERFEDGWRDGPSAESKDTTGTPPPVVGWAIVNCFTRAGNFHPLSSRGWHTGHWCLPRARRCATSGTLQLCGEGVGADRGACALPGCRGHLEDDCHASIAGDASGQCACALQQPFHFCMSNTVCERRAMMLQAAASAALAAAAQSVGGMSDVHIRGLAIWGSQTGM